MGYIVVYCVCKLDIWKWIGFHGNFVLDIKYVDIKMDQTGRKRKKSTREREIEGSGKGVEEREGRFHISLFVIARSCFVVPPILYEQMICSCA